MFSQKSSKTFKNLQKFIKNCLFLIFQESNFKNISEISERLFSNFSKIS